jgi:hypothetical protein
MGDRGSRRRVTDAHCGSNHAETKWRISRCTSQKARSWAHPSLAPNHPRAAIDRPPDWIRHAGPGAHQPCGADGVREPAGGCGTDPCGTTAAPCCSAAPAERLALRVRAVGGAAGGVTGSDAGRAKTSSFSVPLNWFKLRLGFRSRMSDRSLLVYCQKVHRVQGSGTVGAGAGVYCAIHKGYLAQAGSALSPYSAQKPLEV